MVRALVFDFDGLILDTEGPIFEAWREVFRAHGHDFLPGEWQHVIGRAAHFDPMDELERRLGRRLDRERLGPTGLLGGIRKQNDFLFPVGAGLTTGFVFHTQLQIDYNYNFDVVRERDRGGSELVVHISRSF